MEVITIGLAVNIDVEVIQIVGGIFAKRHKKAALIIIHFPAS